MYMTYHMLYPTVNEETEIIIACLLFATSARTQMNMTNVTKQRRTTDCGIYAICLMQLKH